MYTLHRWDLNVQTNYLRLVAAMERLGAEQNERVYMLLNGTRLLGGYERISGELFAAIDDTLAAAPLAPPLPLQPPPVPAPQPVPDLGRRFARFTLPSVLAAGLADGFNPCAFSTLVFLISVLATAQVRGRRILLIGAAFCTGSFLSYLLIGLGLLHAWRRLAAFETARTVLDSLVIGLLAVLAVYSFVDAFRFRRSHRARDVTLQLPGRVKNVIHRIIRTELGHHAQVLSGFVVGVAVTALESVCTGQMYLPTIALVVRSGIAPRRGLVYLLLYNLMFILPLIAVFLLTWGGLTLARLMRWSVTQVVMAKVLFGFFFLALAALMVLLRM
jgi:MFS family permease